MLRIKYVVWLLSFIMTTNVFAGTIHVSSVAQLSSAIVSALPGDSIIVANGVYTTSGIGVACVGTAAQPIVIAAETVSGVEMNGTSGFSVNSPAAYVIIKGFKFTHSTGTAKINVGATHCTMTRNIFECAPAGTGDKPYLMISGDDNEISFNTFQNKTTEGQMISIQGPGGSGMAQRTWVHHNYFYNFPSTTNNCAAIQIGLSGRSLSAAYSIVEYNLFVKTRGENEGGVCNKSCNNTYRYNTFGDSCEELSLRHGNFCEVYGNYFIGSTGLRFSADDHKIYNNYFQGCLTAINCTSGDGEVANGAALTSHDRPDRVKIMFNTLINCSTNFQEPGRTNGLGATYITFANNIIQGGSPPSIRDIYTNPTWEGNVIWNTSGGDMPASGYTLIDPQLAVDTFGVYHIKSTSPAIDFSSGSYPGITDDIDGQPRNGKLDVGSDEYSNAAIIHKPLTLDDVGVNGGYGATAPTAPSTLVATVVTSRKINLTWKDNSYNEIVFRIERSADGGTTWSSLTTVSPNIINYNDTTVAASTAYYYRVRAENSTGNSDYSNIVNATTPAGLPIVAPSNLVATPKSSSKIDISWTDNSNNEESFRIERSKGTDTTWGVVTSVGINVTQYSDNGLTDSTTYRYRLRAENVLGSSNYSNIATATTYHLDANGNLALNRPVTYSSQQMEGGTSDNPASNAVDGNTTTRWSSARNTVWPQWIEVDLGSVMKFNKTQVVCFSDRAYQYYIEVRNDTNSTYTQVLNRRNSTTPGTVAAPVTDVFDTTNGRYVKVTVTGASGYAGPWTSINEFMIYLTNEPKTVSVARTGAAIVEGYRLYDAYPNPFNPTTVIGYQVPVTSRISLKIYNVLGKEIATLVNGVKSAGTYTIQWDARNMPSGMYMARMIAGNYTKTIKLILMK